MTKTGRNNMEFELVHIKARELSLNDAFMNYEPRTMREKETKELIKESILAKVENFYVANCDPSFTEDGQGLMFAPGNMPAVGKSYNWNVKAALEVMPERNSRIGTRLQRGAYLGYLMKHLVSQGKSIKTAWELFCNNSLALGNYCNSKDSVGYLELTGSRPIKEFFGLSDLGNTIKYVANDKGEKGFWKVGGSCYNSSDTCPISKFFPYYLCADSEFCTAATTAWIVFS